jgi:cell division protein FtsB
MIDPATVVHRIDQLRGEIAAGEQALRELDARREQLVAGLLRLSGAVQALEGVVSADARSSTGAAR